jgi:hypothetical protein
MCLRLPPVAGGLAQLLDGFGLVGAQGVDDGPGDGECHGIAADPAFIRPAPARAYSVIVRSFGGRGRRKARRAKAEAIQGHEERLDCVVASAPRNDGVEFPPAYPRHCERSEAIQKATKEAWIASSQVLLDRN